jgi:hypothetical protein
MSRSHKGRKDFKVNNILARVVANKKKEAAPMADFMTITFLGVYDKKGLKQFLPITDVFKFSNFCLQ